MLHREDGTFRSGWSGSGVIQRLQKRNAQCLAADSKGSPVIAKAQATGEVVAAFRFQGRGKVFWPVSVTARPRRRSLPDQTAIRGATNRHSAGIPRSGQARRPSDVEMQAGEVGEEMAEEAAEVLANQLAILAGQQGIAFSGGPSLRAVGNEILRWAHGPAMFGAC